MAVEVVFQDHREDADLNKVRLPVVWVEYGGKTLCYDMLDGYLNPPAMLHWLSRCDVYFKRSYREDLNAVLLASSPKIRPLGFNYFLSWPGNPLNDGFWRRLAKRFLGHASRDQFTIRSYECSPNRMSRSEEMRVLYWARLWEPQAGLSAEEAAQREAANSMRLEIVKCLKEAFGSRFLGGLADTPLARDRADSSLLCPPELAEKGRYLATVKHCDICVATEGLHRSNGWKIAEYIAASRAIVSQELFYAVPGDFLPGQNYLPFRTPRECVECVERLLSNPVMIDRMQMANHRYYEAFLAPIPFVQRTLETL